MIIEDRTEALAALHAEKFGHLAQPTKSAAAKKTAPVSADDAAVIEKVTLPAKWSRLWNGDAGAYRSASEADLALIGRIAFFTGNDSGRIDRIFRQSSLCRDGEGEKWQRENYRDRTIATALAGKSNFYNWDRPASGDSRPIGERGRA